jgi:hypothetical protein
MLRNAMWTEIHSAIDPELQSSITRIDDDAVMLHHPLIIDPYLTLEGVERANKMFRHNKAVVADARRDGNFWRYISEHERPYRMKVLNEVLPTITDSALAAKLVADVWTDSENISQNHGLWTKAWRLLPDPRATMDQSEQNEFAELPELFRIFRGYTLPRGRLRGLSWTIDQECAERFSGRIPDEHYFVAAGRVRKKDVLAFFNRLLSLSTGSGLNGVVEGAKTRVCTLRRTGPSWPADELG